MGTSSMTVTFTRVQQLEELSSKYKQIQPLLKKALTKAPEYNEEAVLAKVLNGTSQMWLAEDDELLGITITEGVQYPEYLALNIHLLGGTRLKEWMEIGLEKIQQFAKDSGCKEISLSGRKGWEKLLKDFTATRTILTKRL